MSKAEVVSISNLNTVQQGVKSTFDTGLWSSVVSIVVYALVLAFFIANAVFWYRVKTETDYIEKVISDINNTFANGGNSGLRPVPGSTTPLPNPLPTPPPFVSSTTANVLFGISIVLGFFVLLGLVVSIVSTVTIESTRKAIEKSVSVEQISRVPTAVPTAQVFDYFNV